MDHAGTNVATYWAGQKRVAWEKPCRHSVASVAAEARRARHCHLRAFFGDPNLVALSHLACLFICTMHAVFR